MQNGIRGVLGGLNSSLAMGRANPQALQEKYNQGQQLIDLIAMQQIKNERESVSRDMQMKMQTNPATVKDQTEKQVLDMTRNELMQSLLPGVQQQGAAMAAAQGPQGPQGTPPSGGIAGVPAPNMGQVGFAGGGIVSFADGGMPQPTPGATPAPQSMVNPDVQVFLDQFRAKERAIRQNPQQAQQIESMFARDTQNISPDVKRQALQMVDAQSVEGLASGGEVRHFAPGGTTGAGGIASIPLDENLAKVMKLRPELSIEEATAIASQMPPPSKTIGQTADDVTKTIGQMADDVTGWWNNYRAERAARLEEERPVADLMQSDFSLDKDTATLIATGKPPPSATAPTPVQPTPAPQGIIAALPAAKVSSISDADADAENEKNVQMMLDETSRSAPAAPATPAELGPYDKQLAKLQAEEESKLDALISFMLGAGGQTSFASTMGGGARGMEARDARIEAEINDTMGKIETLKIKQAELGLEGKRINVGEEANRIAAENNQLRYEADMAEAQRQIARDGRLTPSNKIALMTALDEKWESPVQEDIVLRSLNAKRSAVNGDDPITLEMVLEEGSKFRAAFDAEFARLKEADFQVQQARALEGRSSGADAGGGIT